MNSFKSTSFNGAQGQSIPHESAVAQVQAQVAYIDDLPELKGTLYAAPIMSNVAHARLLGIDTSKALEIPGVVAVMTAKDLINDPILAAFGHDEPIWAMDTVSFLGQVVGVVIADTVMAARRASRLVQLQTQALPAILDARSAHAQQSYVLPPVHVNRGNAQEAMKKSEHTLTGQLSVGGQEHFYLEGHIAYAIPLEQKQWLIHSSTQHPGEVQHWVAHALGIAQNAVTVQNRRMGGGFGGKETQAGHVAVWAAVAANHLQRPIKLRLDRDEDFIITGKRHPFEYDYHVGFDSTGLITALDISMYVNCGFSADLSGPVADRAIFHTDNAYFLSDVSIHSYRCKTQTQSHTAFRGFGGPQGVIIIETIMGEIARYLKKDAFIVRMLNLYGKQTRNTTHYAMTVEDNILHDLLPKLAQDCQYVQRKAQIAAWNKTQTTLQRGIAITPVKFGISFTATLFNQAGALVHVYTDASVHINHGGTEMGQGLNTKVMQIVADELGIPFSQVRPSASDTSKIPNASATAASSATDLNGRAAQFAARNVRANLATFVAGLDGCGAGAIQFKNGQIITPKRTHLFKDIVALAYANRIQLWSDGFYRTPKIHYDKTTLSGRPFYYFAYGAACTEVAIDTLTGENRILRVDILHDVGTSINPALDVGQIEGAFVQGLGWLTTEELIWDAHGKLTTHAPSTYKIPTTGDIPKHLKVTLWSAANREDNVFGSKAVGEPPFMLSISVFEALREAIFAAKQNIVSKTNSSQTTEPTKSSLNLNAPATNERILKALYG